MSTDRPAAKPLEEYIHDVGIGGNHLASALHALGMQPAEWRRSVYDEVLERFGQPAADIWVAWKAIMNYRDARKRMESGDPGVAVGPSTDTASFAPADSVRSARADLSSEVNPSVPNGGEIGHSSLLRQAWPIWREHQRQCGVQETGVFITNEQSEPAAPEPQSVREASRNVAKVVLKYLGKEPERMQELLAAINALREVDKSAAVRAVAPPQEPT